MPTELAPERDSFLFILVWIAATTFIAAAGLSFVFPTVYVFGAWVLLNLGIYGFRSVMLSKERYVFHDDRIIKHQGTPFTDSKAELALKKITKIRLKLPWLRHYLFGTGVINIESAGGGGTEVTIKDVEKPKKWFDRIQDAMQDNGYSLARDELVYDTSPARLGVVFETIARIAGILFFIGFIGVGVSSVFGGGPTAALGILIVITAGVFIYQNLMRRKYYIYNDTIQYKEGWFNKYDSIIPGEKLSDSYVKQGLIDKIFGLYDVGISSKGSTNDVHFKNIDNGPELETVVDRAIENTTELPTFEQTKEGTESEAPSNIAEVDTTTTRDFTPYGPRALLSSISIVAITIIALIVGFSIDIVSIGSVIQYIIPIAIVSVFAVVSPLLTWLFTTYKLKKKSIASHYDFISSDHTEFSFEKVTGLVIKRSPFDMLLGTVHIDVWSIGSSETLSLAYVKPDNGLIETLHDKKGLELASPYNKYGMTFTIGSFLLKTLPLTSIAAVGLTATYIFASQWLPLASVGVAAVYILAIIYDTVFYNLASLTAYEDGIHCHKGVLFQRDYYTTLEDVKDVTSMQYPFIETGTLTFNVAGETVTRSDQGKSYQSYSFGMEYLPKVRDEHATIDAALWNRPAAEEFGQVKEEERFAINGAPALKNYFVFWGMLFPLTIVLIWFVPFLLWARIVKSYHLDDFRAIARSGILYKTQRTIRFSKIDHIDTDRSFINKLCSNAKLTIQSTGSSRPEIVMRDLDNLQTFSDELSNYY